MTKERLRWLAEAAVIGILIRHYWGAYKLSRINNTRTGALREMLFKPF